MLQPVNDIIISSQNPKMFQWNS